EGGEANEMDVPPCNPLLDLRFVALVLSRTLNGSSEGKRINEESKGRQFCRPFCVRKPHHPDRKNPKGQAGHRRLPHSSFVAKC
ncbi:MAG: hypothetical protein ACXU9X_15065, partial [Thermodesulfobacteriota bacterium]